LVCAANVLPYALGPLLALLLSISRRLQHALLLKHGLQVVKHGLQVVSDFQRGRVLTGNL
jgi:hypothetical protein